MWLDSAEVVDVYVGTRAVAVVRRGQPPVATEVEGFSEAVQVVRLALPKLRPRSRLRVWLSGGLCRPFLQPVIEGVAGRAERDQVARSMAATACGLEGPCVVWLNDTNVGAPLLGVAMVEETLTALLAACQDNRLGKHRLRSVRPWWSEFHRSVAQQQPDATMIAVHDCDSMTVLKATGDVYEAATTVTPLLDVAAADAALARLLMATNIEAKDVQVGRLVPTGGGTVDRMPGLALSELVTGRQ